MASYRPLILGESMKNVYALGGILKSWNIQTMKCTSAPMGTEKAAAYTLQAFHTAMNEYTYPLCRGCIMPRQGRGYEEMVCG